MRWNHSNIAPFRFDNFLKIVKSTFARWAFLPGTSCSKVIKFNRPLWTLLTACCLLAAPTTRAQTAATAAARIDARQIMVGDQARLFIEVQNPSAASLQWAVIPDTFNNLEVVERGRIDTIRNGAAVSYRQRLLITGFDSGMYQIPPF